jgi:nitrite reductase/ring-hydroxylating ferredoxin subunit
MSRKSLRRDDRRGPPGSRPDPVETFEVKVDDGDLQIAL